MEKNPIQDAVRKDRREQKLGERPVCRFCGNENLWALIEVPEKLLEEDHVVGRAHDPDMTQAICRNCHAIKHETARREGVDLEPQSTFLERLAQVLKMLGVHLQTLAERCLVWAEQILEFVGMLDRECEGWRDEPEAE